MRRQTIAVLAASMAMSGVMGAPAAAAPIAAEVDVSEHVVEGFVAADPGPGVSAASGAADSGSGAASVGAVAGLSRPVEAPEEFSLVGFEMAHGSALRVRTSVDGRDWSPWAVVEELHDGPDLTTGGHAGSTATGVEHDAAERTPSAPVWVGEARWLQIGGEHLEDVRAHVIDARGDRASIDESLTRQPGDESSTLAAQSSRPRIVSRREWGADESLSGDSATAPVRLAIIHHTATSNNYSRAEAPAIVRSIQRYHGRTLGWSDIGYNFLVDRFGTVYEGRAGGVKNGVIGAHARGFNTNSTGVAVIGNFDTAEPTESSVDGVRELLAWKLSVHDIDPNSMVKVESGGSPQYPAGEEVRLPAIGGHRDTGDTSCPGRDLYSMLKSIRDGVERDMEHDSMSSAEMAARCLPEGDPNVGPLWRARGPDRVSTAVVASRWYWRSSATAVIARARDFPDALSAGAVSARYDAPLLLSDGARLDAAVATRLRELGVQQVLLMGGSAVLSDQLAADVAGLGMTVARVAGRDRFATAAQAALRAGAPSGEAVVALGRHADPNRAWPDAVAAGALAASPDHLPTLLTTTASLPAATADAIRTLGVHTVWIVGDEAVVSPTVAAQIQALGVTVRRLGGPNRYETSIAVAREARERFAAATPVVLASGAAYPDGLTSAAIGARRGAPLLLVPPCGMEQAPATLTYLAATPPPYTDAVLLGGTSAVSERVKWQIGTVLG